MSFWRTAAWLVTAGAACLAVACGVSGVLDRFLGLVPPAQRPAWPGGYGVDDAFMLLLLHEGGIHAFDLVRAVPVARSGGASGDGQPNDIAVYG